MRKSIGLVLEGGGMRGVYTAGVLDFFMDNNIYFPYIIGVSMGACNAASYVSKQRGRAKIVDIDYTKDPRFFSYRNLIKNRSVFNMDLIFDEIPNKLCPFDFNTFFNSNQKFIITATDCETGKPIYFDKDNCDDVLKVMRASSSLPFIAPIVDIGGKKCLDGGLSDSIPARKALMDGNEKLVIVMTRNKGYIKKPFKFKRITKRLYYNYPKIVDSILHRYKKYNEDVRYIEELEIEGKAFIIRPSIPLFVDRIEKNVAKLNTLYRRGYQDAKDNFEKLKAFIDEGNNKKIDKDKISIREAAINDLKTIVDIYNSTIPGRMVTADLECVTVEDRKAWFYAHNNHSRPLWVAEIDGKIAGWLSFQSFYGRPAYDNTVELSIYIHEDYRKIGLGKIFMEYAIEKSCDLKVKTILGFIFGHNEPSLNLFERFGFERWGYLPKIAELEGVERDLVIMGLRI